MEVSGAAAGRAAFQRTRQQPNFCVSGCSTHSTAGSRKARRSCGLRHAGGTCRAGGRERGRWAAAIVRGRPAHSSRRSLGQRERSQFRRRTVTGVPFLTESRSCWMWAGSVSGPCRKRLQQGGGRKGSRFRGRGTCRSHARFGRQRSRRASAAAASAGRPLLLTNCARSPPPCCTPSSCRSPRWHTPERRAELKEFRELESYCGIKRRSNACSVLSVLGGSARPPHQRAVGLRGIGDDECVTKLRAGGGRGQAAGTFGWGGGGERAAGRPSVVGV